VFGVHSRPSEGRESLKKSLGGGFGLLVVFALGLFGGSVVWCGGNNNQKKTKKKTKKKQKKKKKRKKRREKEKKKKKTKPMAWGGLVVGGVGVGFLGLGCCGRGWLDQHTPTRCGWFRGLGGWGGGEFCVKGEEAELEYSH